MKSVHWRGRLMMKGQLKNTSIARISFINVLFVDYNPLFKVGRVEKKLQLLDRTQVWCAVEIRHPVRPFLSLPFSSFLFNFFFLWQSKSRKDRMLIKR